MSEPKGHILLPENIRKEHDKNNVGIGVTTLIRLCHTASYNRGWWRDQETGEDLLDPALPLFKYARMTKLMLAVSEIAECMEGYRTEAPDDKLPQFSMEIVEIADAIIRLCDYAGAYKLPVVEAILAKMDFNAVRKDHDVETRKAKGGKKF